MALEVRAPKNAWKLTIVCYSEDERDDDPDDLYRRAVESVDTTNEYGYPVRCIHVGAERAVETGDG